MFPDESSHTGVDCGIGIVFDFFVLADEMKLSDGLFSTEKSVDQ